MQQDYGGVRSFHITILFRSTLEAWQFVPVAHNQFGKLSVIVLDKVANFAFICIASCVKAITSINQNTPVFDVMQKYLPVAAQVNHPPVVY